MTHTINLRPETEERLTRHAARTGKPIDTVITDLVEEAVERVSIEPRTSSKQEAEPSLMDVLRSLGAGSVRGTAREDGTPWSEVEAACDTH
jgi:hypothetical protein